jgi:hypothetical protein
MKPKEDIMVYYVDNCGVKQIDYPKSLALAKSKIMALERALKKAQDDVHDLLGG